MPLSRNPIWSTSLMAAGHGERSSSTADAAAVEELRSPCPAAINEVLQMGFRLKGIHLAFIAVALITLACGPSAGSDNAARGAPPPEVSIVTVTPSTVSLNYEFSAQVIP